MEIRVYCEDETHPHMSSKRTCLLFFRQVATGFMADEVGGCDALVHALLSVEPDIPNADDLILRAAVLTAYLAEQGSLRCAQHVIRAPF